MVLWVDAEMMGPHSTHGYNCIVVGFILTTNELLCLTLYEESIALCARQGSISGPTVLWEDMVTPLHFVSYLV